MTSPNWWRLFVPTIKHALVFVQHFVDTHTNDDTLFDFVHREMKTKKKTLFSIATALWWLVCFFFLAKYYHEAAAAAGHAQPSC